MVAATGSGILIGIISLVTIILAIGGGGYMWLRSKPFSFHCLGCEEPSWWFKCTEHSGPGTDSCDTFLEVDSAVNEAKQNIKDIKSEIQKIKDGILKPIEAFNSIKNTLDSTFESFQIKEIPQIDPSSVHIPNANMGSCGFNIPGVGNIDPCKGAEASVNGSVYVLNQSMKGAITGMNLTMEGISKIPGIVKQLKGIIDSSVDDIKSQLDQLNIFKGLFEEVNQLVNNFKKLDIVVYLQVLFVKALRKVIPGISFGNAVAILLMGITFLIGSSFIGILFTILMGVRLLIPPII